MNITKEKLDLVRDFILQLREDRIQIFQLHAGEFKLSMADVQMEEDVRPSEDIPPITQDTEIVPMTPLDRVMQGRGINLNRGNT